MTSSCSLVSHTIVFALAVLFSTSCTDSDDDDGRPPRDSGDVIKGEGLSCEIAKTLETHCWGCHGEVPTAGAPYSLLSRSELLLTSIQGQTRAARSVTRMRAPMGQMPPAGRPRVPEADIGVLEAWIAAGTPEAQCASGAQTTPAL
jgi:uncharacterized membrane protein